MNKHSKINLIYIASIGHSGSTLLESMLGAQSQIATCGEIHIWPSEIVQSNVMPCSCGKSISECSFWVKVRQLVDPLQQPHPQIHFFREQHNAGHTLRLKRLGDFSKRELSPQLFEKIKMYGQNNFNVLRAFLKVMQEMHGSQSEWVVDASKDPYRLLWLTRSNFFNLKVLHVVKSPSAFAYSMIKRLPKNATHIPRKYLYETARQSLKWSIENYLISQVAKNHLASHDYLLVNYEELASKPVETFKKICSVIGCSFEEQAVNNFREGSIHTIAGNPMRYRHGGIVLDEKWRTSLPSTSRKVAEILTWINRSNYGY